MQEADEQSLHTTHVFLEGLANEEQFHHVTQQFPKPIPAESPQVVWLSGFAHTPLKLCVHAASMSSSSKPLKKRTS